MSCSNGKGDCFKVAFEMLLEDENMILVHGLPFGTGGDAEGLRYNHAWCELDGLVYDGTIPIIINKEEYYKLGDIQITYKYNREEALKKIFETEIYGCWEDELKEYP